MLQCETTIDTPDPKMEALQAADEASVGIIYLSPYTKPISARQPLTHKQSWALCIWAFYWVRKYLHFFRCSSRWFM